MAIPGIRRPWTIFSSCRCRRRTSAKFSGTTARASMRSKKRRVRQRSRSRKKEESTIMEAKPQNALERFITKTRALFAKEPDLDKRWTALAPVLAELLADPEVLEASKSWPDCVPA